MVLSTPEAKKFYDRFGSKQDKQGFYEDKALALMIQQAALFNAKSVFELGCGTGRFALRLLDDHFDSTTRYLGIDLSETMINLASQRLTKYASRAKAEQSDGSMHFPLDDHSVDRVVSTYVLDLLSDADILKAIEEAKRVLSPGGKLCLAGLSRGVTQPSRLVCTVWSTIFKLKASLVGGCRPIRIDSYLNPQDWNIEFHEVITQFAVPSEILIASPR